MDKRYLTNALITLSLMAISQDLLFSIKPSTRSTLGHQWLNNSIDVYQKSLKQGMAG